MEQLLLGNAAIARGLYEAGVTVASSYPGTPSTEITEEAAKFPEIYCEWAPNEKVAVEVAFGASLAGRRSFSAMKHVGLNVAADPLFTVSYTGVNAGMVLCVADDPGMHSSQNEQDSRHYAKAAKLPMLDPADSAECYAFTKLAYELSEQYDVPVLLRTCTRVAHSQSVVALSERTEPEAKPYEKNIAKYVMMPGNAIRRHPVVEERMRALTAYAETTPLNRIEEGTDRSMGILTSSTSYQYVKEVCGEKYPILKIGMIWPLPEQKIRDFAAGVDRLVVVEELDGVLEEHCRNLGLQVTGKELFPMEGELSPNLVAEKLGIPHEQGRTYPDPVPARPPVMCAGCPHRGLFYTLGRLGCTVLGDIGCYTLGAVAPLSAMEMCLDMGASIGANHGFHKAGTQGKKVVSVIGDSTFMHSGMTGLCNVAYNQSNATVIILDNSITGMTGHQQNPTTGFNLRGDPAGKIDLEALCHALGIDRVRVVDPYDLEACRQAVSEELEADAPSVIISRRPCALLKYVKHGKPFEVDPGKCKSCRACMRIGCPAISFKEQARIDATLCVGCGVCAQLCKFDALKEGK